MEIGEKLGGGDVNKLQLLLYILSVGSLRMCMCIRRQVMRVYEARTFWPHWMAAPPVTVYWMPGSPLCILPSSLLFLSLSLSLLFYILSSSFRRLFHSAPRERETVHNFRV